MNDQPLSRDERIEEFGEKHVERQDWWSEEMDLVKDVAKDVIGVLEERDDARIERRGRYVQTDGEHELRFTVAVAGNPLDEELQK